MPGAPTDRDEASSINDRQRSMVRSVGVVLLAIGVVQLAVGSVFLYRAYDFSRNTVSVVATATDVKSHSTDNGTNYSVTFVFDASDGVEHRVRPWYSASWFPSREGQSVEILYDARNPRRIAVSGWFFNWGFPSILVVGSCIPLLIGGVASFARLAKPVQRSMAAAD